MMRLQMKSLFKVLLYGKYHNNLLITALCSWDAWANFLLIIQIEWKVFYSNWKLKTIYKILHMAWQLYYHVQNFVVICCPEIELQRAKFSISMGGWVGLWGFLWWAPSAKGKDHHGVSSGWSSVWHRSNTGLSSTQYEQIPIILGVWPFWLTPFYFRSITFWRAYG